MHYVRKICGYSTVLGRPLPSPYCDYWCPKIRSSVNLNGLRNSLSYFKSSFNHQFRSLVDSVVIEALDKFKLPQKIHPWHINEVLSSDKIKWSHSPGLPWRWRNFTSKRDVPDTYTKYFCHKIKHGLSVPIHPCAAYARSHLAEEEKLRLVWGYPAHITFAEGMFAIPLIESYQRHRTPYALWFRVNSNHWAQVARSRRGKWLCLDYSKFDATVSEYLIRAAFRVIRHQFDFTQYNNGGTPDAIEIDRLWNWLERYFIETPMCLPNGELYVKRGGVPSGSYFTNLVDTVVNFIVTRSLCRLTGVKINSELYFGDDALLDVEDADIELMSYYAEEVFGMEISEKKSSIGVGFTFLGYENCYGFPYRPTTDYFDHLKMPERSDEDIADFNTRCLMLMYCTFGMNPRYWIYASKVLGRSSEFRPISRDQERFLEIFDLAISWRLPTCGELISRLI